MVCKSHTQLSEFNKNTHTYEILIQLYFFLVTCLLTIIDTSDRHHYTTHYTHYYITHYNRHQFPLSLFWFQNLVPVYINLIYNIIHSQYSTTIVLVFSILSLNFTSKFLSVLYLRTDFSTVS